MKIPRLFFSNDAKFNRNVAVGALNLAATIQLVWFYLSAVPCYLDLSKFECGHERAPFQYRLLLMFPLRWAHQAKFLQYLARHLSAQRAWFPNGVRPEGLVQAIVDLLCLIVTGLVARAIYKAASPYRLLTPFVYPLTLLMVLCTYVLSTTHRLRFIYDLPSVCFFAVGIYLIYFRQHAILQALLFALATINRETSLFLLAFFLLAELDRAPKPRWRVLLKPSTSLMLLSLSFFWIAWRQWVRQRFAANLSVDDSRLWLNVGTLLWPVAWAQLLSTFAFLAPVILMRRKLIYDSTLRLWLWIVPLWFVLMLRYGLLIETRIFGELIPFIACCAALLAERSLVGRLRPQG